MANSFTAVIPSLLANMLPVLRANSVTPRLVSRDYDALAAMPGSTVTVPVPQTAAASDVTAAVTAPSNVDHTPTSVSIALSNWKESYFHLTDAEMGQIMNGYVPRQAESNFLALINAIDLSVLAAMNVAAGAAHGTAATAPFATIALALQPNKLLHDHLAPVNDRHVIMDASAEANLLALEPFANGTFTGDTTAMIDGKINRRVGSQWWMNQNCPSHTAGTGASYTTSAAGFAVGATSIPIITGTGTVLAGDVVTFAGDTNKYVVKTGVGAPGTIVLNAPGLKVAIAASATAMTIVATHRANFAFQRDAVVFVSRGFQPSASGQVNSKSMSDPVSGLTVRLEVNRQHKQDRWSFDAQWGVGVVRPQGVIKILG